MSNDRTTSHGYRLLHSADAVDLSRAQDGLPLLISHDQSALPIGRVHSLQLAGDALTGALTFGARGADIEADMRAGIITDVSVGAEFAGKDSEDDDGVIVIRRWRPVEVSAVAIGAIEGAQVMTHSKQDREMPNTERLDAIRSVFAPFKGAEYDAMRLQAIDNDWSAEQATQHLLNHAAAQSAKAVETVQNIDVGSDQRDKYLEGAQIALRYRAGNYSVSEKGAEQRKADQAALVGNEFAGFSLVELAREALRRSGIQCAGWSPERVCDVALKGTAETQTLNNATGYTSSDFTSLISTNALGALAAGYEDAPETWQQWVSVKSMSNFQQHRFPNLSSFSDLEQRVEGGVYTHGGFSDKHEVMTLKEFGRQFSVDRQLLINDQMSALTEVPRRMGIAANRNVGDLVYAILTTGATAVTMTEDATLLFDASTHGNYVTSGAAPSVATLNSGFVAMATQTDPSANATLGIRPRYLLVPNALEATSRVLLASNNDPAITPETPNPFQGAVQLISDHRLQTFNSAGWFLTAAPGQLVETVAVGFLNGQSSPTLSEETTAARPGIIYTVMHDAIAGALDWRGMYYNDGA